MANKRITDVDFISSLSGDESFFVNQNNALRQVNKNNIIFGIINGGTGAKTIEDARNNLNVYSKDEVYSKSESVIMKNSTLIIPTDAWEINDSYDGLYYVNMNSSAPYVTETSTVFVTPAQLPISNFNAYIENGVRACEQSLNTIGFIADTKPDVDIIINYSVFA